MKEMPLKKYLPFIRMLPVLMFSVFLISCGNQEDSEAEYQIYYVNKESTGLVSDGYEAESGDTGELVDELLAKMDNPGDAGRKAAKPQNVSVDSYMMEESFLYMDFSQEYLTMDAITEVLYRAAAVKTLTQIPGVEGVSFQIGGIPLTDQKGNAVGVMTADSFVDNTGETINGFKRDTLTLYFAAEDGIHLKQERVEVVYNGNVSMEKLIVEQLIAGPKAEGYRPTLSSDTTVLNINVTDGTCYVNFDSKLREMDADLTEDAVIYSIVDSLTELNTIQKVQISVNGKTDIALRESRRLDKIYERNLDLVEE